MRNVIVEFQAVFAAQLDLLKMKRGQAHSCCKDVVTGVAVRADAGMNSLLSTVTAKLP